MYRSILFAFVLFISANALTFADQAEQVITLKDGSQIKGVLAGIDNGVYTVKTPIIGDVHVSAGDVASITNSSGTDGAVASAPAPTAPASTGSGPNMDQEIAASQRQLMSNPQTMATLQEMAQDPDIVKALSDPDLVQAVTSHDYQAVQNNPRVQELMSNPKMQAFLQKLAAQQQQQQQNTTSSQ